MPKVLNKYSLPPFKSINDAERVYIGRPSKWGNPFILGQAGNRNQVVTQYREWILKQPALIAALPELKGKDLVCFCAPQACHGDVLLDLANAQEHHSGCITQHHGEPCSASGD